MVMCVSSDKRVFLNNKHDEQQLIGCIVSGIILAWPFEAIVKKKIVILYNFRRYNLPDL